MPVEPTKSTPAESTTAILIVDDDQSIAMWLKTSLRLMRDELPCSSEWAATGAAALEELQRRNYDLVLLDYNLPDIDGLSLLGQIQDMPAAWQPAVIMLTGGGSEAVAVDAMKQGAKDYLVKGALEQTTLRRAIMSALDRRCLEMQLSRYTEELRRKNRQMEAELAMACEVQQALISQQYPVFPPDAAPEHSALKFCHRWIPSSEMAGDFFDVLEISPTKAGVFVCDVMGHGVRAALVTALVRGLLEELQPVAAEPGRFLESLNRGLKTILERTSDVIFVTASYVVIDLEKAELCYANASHPLPLYLQRKAGQVVALQTAEGPGPALGLLPDSTYDTASRPLMEGDGLLLFTDGIVEVEGADGEEFGSARLASAVEHRLKGPMSQLCDGLLDDLRRYKAAAGSNQGFTDDVCLVTVEFARVGSR